MQLPPAPPFFIYCFFTMEIVGHIQKIISQCAAVEGYGEETAALGRFSREREGIVNLSNAEQEGS